MGRWLLLLFFVQLLLEHLILLLLIEALWPSVDAAASATSEGSIQEKHCSKCRRKSSFRNSLPDGGRRSCVQRYENEGSKKMQKRLDATAADASKK